MVSENAAASAAVSSVVEGLLAREEEVPDPAAPAEGEYAEYTEEQQYAVSFSPFKF